MCKWSGGYGLHVFHPLVPECGDPAVGNVVHIATVEIEVSGVFCKQIASFTTNSIVRLPCWSILVSSSVDGMVLHPDMFGYGRLVHEAFDARVLMLL